MSRRATVGAGAGVLQRVRTVDRARVRLLCIPYAGGSSRVFQPWLELVPEGVELWAVEAPGRGSRIAEPPHESLEPLLEEVLAAVEPELDVPLAVFGHSMGALLGFELARALRQRDLPQPVELFVSGHQAPQLPPTEPPTRGLSDGDFVQRLRRLGGTPEEALDHEDLMEIFLPLLRADFAAVETWVYRPEPPLGCGITAFGGRSDTWVRPEQLEAWRVHTVGRFEVQLLPGGHFFLHHSATSLLAAISGRLAHLLNP